MSFTLEFTKTALEDIEKHKLAGDKKVLSKLEQLLNELREHPLTGTGRPEALRHDLQGLYSRRINRKHRLVYGIKEESVVVIVVSAYTHYGDK
ncbi:MAG: Txe/YoeB family addiction module toxin [Saprospiraceae bacterium]|jgi:toxin YoeB|nr:MAG: Txe/YoeB family addiction module toxin [Candidatus Parvibacillus calidus]MBX2938000.1 Txe/YoeB family addiction module toxin [Saprospiraceae bacterium]MBX7179407.1 Txe/YoeB family addiction module toxin [Saprospiraceae bacterium]MCB0591031.1 Txe/YoeB family addiction module toxin [Saprospiraceae bacterium]MCC7148777.1 Txe/YoeB family addiction module toxin [Saprospiraceae bacterium]